MPLAYLQYPSVRRQLTLHKTKRMFDEEKVAAQLNTLCRGLPTPDAENSALGREALPAKKTTKTNIKKEASSFDIDRIKTEKMDDSPVKPNMNAVKDRRENVLLAAG